MHCLCIYPDNYTIGDIIFTYFLFYSFRRFLFYFYPRSKSAFTLIQPSIKPTICRPMQYGHHRVSRFEKCKKHLIIARFFNRFFYLSPKNLACNNPYPHCRVFLCPQKKISTRGMEKRLPPPSISFDKRHISYAFCSPLTTNR